MRSISSLFVILAIFVSAFSPAFGQRQKLAERASKRAERPTPIPSKQSTRFATVESYSEGAGAYIRWRMENELSNAGFMVYRMSRFGGRPVSEFVPGAAFRFGDDAISGQTYNYFDPAGSIGSAYYIEAIGTNDVRVASSTTATNYVHDVESLDGGGVLRDSASRLNAEPTRMVKDLIVDSELRSEIAASTVSPDPVQHRWAVSQPGVRIGVRKGGLIRVSKASLQNAGFNVNGDPTNWQLYMEGVERPIIVGPNADYIEFFGKTLDTLESDTRMYYLFVGPSAGRRIQSSVLRRGLTNFAANKYNQSFYLEEKTIYTQRLLNGRQENFFGRPIFSSSDTDLPFNLSGIDRTAGNRTIRVDLRGFSNGLHNVTVSLNGTPLGQVTGANQQRLAKTFSVPVSLLLDGQNILRMRTASGIALFDNLGIDFARNYFADAGKLDFYTDNYKKAVTNGFASPDVRLFDVTSEADPKLMSNVDVVQTNGTWGPVIPAGRGRVFSAVGPTAFSEPASVTANIPELIGDPSQAGKLIIITHKNYLAEAQTWAAYRTSPETSVKVVQVEEIYDEFGYGSLSSASIRAFLNYAKNNWITPPSYVLLLGDATVDPRDYLGNSVLIQPNVEPTWNMVPTEIVDTLYEETGSDDALTDFNTDGLAEIPIGRISSRTRAGITTIFNKTVQFEASITPNVLDRGALFAYDWNDGYQFDAMSNRIMATLPAAVPKTTVVHAAGAFNTVVNAFNEIDPTTPANSGIFVANYTGHGNAGAWRNDQLFSSERIPLLTNATNPTLITALTCLNGYFVILDSGDSLAEEMTKATNGGAVAMWASTGQTTPDIQEIMAKRFYMKLGEGSIPRMGDLVNDAKSQLPPGTDVRRSWALFGDPMLKVR